MGYSQKFNNLDLETIPGIGPKTKVALKNIGIKNIQNLLFFLPSFLIDKTQLSNINNVVNGQKVLFIGIIKQIFKTKGARQSLIVKIDVGGGQIQIRFLHKIMIYSYLHSGEKVRISGILYIRNKLYEMIHPDIEVINSNKKLELITPYYSTKKSVSQHKIRTFIKHATNLFNKNNFLMEVFGSNILTSYDIPDIKTAINFCHFPLENSFEQAEINFIKAKKKIHF